VRCCAVGVCVKFVLFFNAVSEILYLLLVGFLKEINTSLSKSIHKINDNSSVKHNSHFFRGYIFQIDLVCLMEDLSFTLY
jgi:hypothetical protein